MRKFLFALLLVGAPAAFAADVVVFTQPGGGVSVVYPAPGVTMATVLADSIPGDATDVTVVDGATIPADSGFSDAWQQSGGIITVPLTAARQVARRRITALVRREIALLEDIRTEAQIGNDSVLVGQINARKTAIQSTIIPAIRDGIIAAASIADLKAVRQAYLDNRPQRVKDELP